MNKSTAKIVQTVTLLLCSILILTSISNCMGCFNSESGSQTGDRTTETRVMLGTYCTITIGLPKQSLLIEEAFKLCAQMESLLSMNIEGSDVWRINNAQGEPVAVDPLTIEVIEKGIEFGEISDGMFDITIGRLSSLWNFGSDFSDSAGKQEVPADSMREEALKTVDYKQIEINYSENTVTLSNPSAWIDLGGIAKGFMADKIAGFLTENGVESGIIDLGGDIVVIGSRPDGDLWRLGIQEPFSNTDELIGVMEYSNASVVSSGIYERQFTYNGIRYHHILDVNSGMPAISDVVAATVVSGSASTGEGAATIIVIAGSERAQEIFDKIPGLIGAVLILKDKSILTFGDVSLELLAQ